MKLLKKHALFNLLFLIISISCSKKEKDALKHILLHTEKRNSIECNSLIECVSAVVNDLQSIFGKETVPDFTSFQDLIDSTGAELKKSCSDNLDTPVLIDSLISIIYEKWAIVFDSDQDNLKSLFPHTVISHKKGSCLGVSLLFLLFAEKLNYPLYGILLPGHFFVRYDDGKTYRNIEPNKRGYNHPYEYYRERYGINDNSWYTMKSLSSKETAAVLYFNIANICL
ncbi:unnamed protein product, partial [marine sediment metagenome]